MLFTLITVPPLGLRVLSVSLHAGFIPGSSRFSSTGSSPVNVALPHHWITLCIIRADSSEAVITTNVDVWWNGLKVTFLGLTSNRVPIFLFIASERYRADFELSVGDSGVFFPDVRICRSASRAFPMPWENSSDSAKSDSSFENDEDLDVVISTFSPGFFLALNISDVVGERAWEDPACDWDRANPISCNFLRHRFSKLCLFVISISGDSGLEGISALILSHAICEGASGESIKFSFLRPIYSPIDLYHGDQ